MLARNRERGYDPFVVVMMEQGLTDMLPMDLVYPSKFNRFCFSFEWRTYLCTICDGLKQYHDGYSRQRVSERPWSTRARTSLESSVCIC